MWLKYLARVILLVYQLAILFSQYFGTKVLHIFSFKSYKISRRRKTGGGVWILRLIAVIMILDYYTPVTILTHIIEHQLHYEKSDCSRAFNRFTIACGLDMISAISAADIAFIMHAEFKVRLVTKSLVREMKCSPQQQNHSTLRVYKFIEREIVQGEKPHIVRGFDSDPEAQFSNLRGLSANVLPTYPTLDYRNQNGIAPRNWERLIFAIIPIQDDTFLQIIAIWFDQNFNSLKRYCLWSQVQDTEHWKHLPIENRQSLLLALCYDLCDVD